MKVLRIRKCPILSTRSVRRASGLLETGISVNSTNALPCFDFFECDCGHLGRSVDPVASLLVKSGFCRIRFWYAVAPGSGISRETSRNYFWNLTVEAPAIERAVQPLQPVAAPIGQFGPVDLAALPISTFEKGC
jgi:hypothetical protein